MSDITPDAPSSHDREEARLIYEHAAAELRFFKSQQWQVAYYSLLADAALCTAPRLADLRSVAVGMRIVLSLVIVGLTIWSSIVLHSQTKAIDKERNRMNMARQYLPLVEEARRAHGSIRGDGVNGLLLAAIIAAGAIGLAINLFSITICQA